MRYSTFKNFKDNVAVMHEVDDWSNFVLIMAGQCLHLDADEDTKKTKTPSISPAVYVCDNTKRANENVTGWGGWLALDIDNDGPLLPIQIEDAIEVLDPLGLNFLIYTSTKARADLHRFRIVMPLSRELVGDEIASAWNATVQYFAALSPDPTCKDSSRIYAAPAFWQPSGERQPRTLQRL